MMSVNNLSPSYLQSVFASAIQGTNLAANSTTNSASSVGALSSPQPDSSRLSPFAEMLTKLQQLQQTDPAKYKEVTGQIAANLESASQTAAANGNTAAAGKLDQLSEDFGTASQSGQLPSIQDLAQAIGGHHSGHGHHHMHAASNSDGSASTGASSDASAAANPAISQFLAAFQSGGAGNDALNPMNIITNTLSQNGIASS